MAKNEFGLLAKNTEGEWTINGEVVEAGEKVRIEGFFDDKDALKSKNGNRDFELYCNLSIDKAFVLDNGIVCFDITGPFGDYEPTELYAYRAKRMVD